MAVKKRLAGYVHVHQDDGPTAVYGPNDVVPPADAKKIGAHAWVTEPDEAPAAE